MPTICTTGPTGATAMSSLLTVEQLAEFIHKSRASIRSDATRNPQSLPPICRLPNTKRLLWRLEDVESWLAAHVTSPATQERLPDCPKWSQSPNPRLAQDAQPKQPSSPNKNSLVQSRPPRRYNNVSESNLWSLISARHSRYCRHP